MKFKSNLPTECAGSFENDFYNLNAQLLRLGGATVGSSGEELKFHGMSVNWGARVVLHPSFGVSVSEIRERV